MATGPTELQHGAVITRQAHVALRDLKALVDLATEEIHAAELETIVGSWPRTGRQSPASVARCRGDAALREVRVCSTGSPREDGNCRGVAFAQGKSGELALVSTEERTSSPAPALGESRRRQRHSAAVEDSYRLPRN